MRRSQLVLPLALALHLAASACAQEPAGRELRSPRGREIKGLIEALGADQFQAREAARTRLLEIGVEALPWLERVKDDADPERAAAASELVRTLRWLVPADLRGLVQDTLDDFPGKTPERRRALLLQLEGLGGQAGPALPWLVIVARFDADPEVRLTGAEVLLRMPALATPEQDEAVLTALAGEAESPRLLLARGRLLRRLGRLEPAIAEVERAGELAPGGGAPRALLIELLAQAGRHAEALPLAEAEVQARPTDPEALVQLGELLLLAGRAPEGLELLRTVAEAATANAHRDLLLRLVHAYLRGKRPDEAEQLLRVALGRFPYDHELNVAMGDLHALRGRARQALDTWLSELVLIAPGSGQYVELTRRLARELVAAGAPQDLAQDEAFFRDAQRGRRLADVHAAVAAWLRGRGLFEDAARELQLTCALSPGDATPRRLLGEVLAEGGRYEEARQAFRAALELAPQDARIQARLEDLEGAAGGSAEGPRDAERCAFWERQVEAGELQAAPEAVPGEVAPPLVAGDVVLAPAGGTTRIYGLAAGDGLPLWRYDAAPPPPPEGALPEQMGLEPVGLLAVPPAIVAATHPARARQRAPLAALLCNVYWRPAHRSWRKATFRGVRAYVIDPLSGQELLARDLELDAQVVRPLPVGRRGRALVCVSPRSGRLELVLLDLVLFRPLWRSRVPATLARAPRFAGERVVLAWPDGLLALGEGGKLLWEHTVAVAPEDGDEQQAGRAFSTGPGPTNDAVLVGTADGRVMRLDAASGEARELARPGAGRLTGDPVLGGGRVFLAERGGAVHALTLAGSDAPASAWRAEPGRAAERELAWAGGLLFGLNGGGDVFEDELPSVQAFDPGDGNVVFQRRVGRPAALVAGDALVAVVSGGRGARAGMQVVAVRPQERFDPLHARLEELRSAAQGALAEGQAEVAAVVARAWVARLGGVERLDRDGLKFLARALSRSNRPDEALDVIYLGEARAQKAEQREWDTLRQELGLQPPPEKKPGEGEKPAGQEKPADGEQPAGNEKPAGEGPAGGEGPSGPTPPSGGQGE